MSCPPQSVYDDLQTALDGRLGVYGVVGPEDAEFEVQTGFGFSAAGCALQGLGDYVLAPGHVDDFGVAQPG